MTLYGYSRAVIRATCYFCITRIVIRIFSKVYFVQLPQIAKHTKLEDESHFFNDNKASFEYDKHKLIGLDSPISKLTATHKNGVAL